MSSPGWDGWIKKRLGVNWNESSVPFSCHSCGEQIKLKKKIKKKERRIAVIARVLHKHCIDVAALSETRLANESQLTESGAGYTFYWIGKSDSQSRQSGVGFAIKTSLNNHLVSLPQGINDKLMSIRFRLSKHHYATIISAYASRKNSMKSC